MSQKAMHGKIIGPEFVYRVERSGDEEQITLMIRSSEKDATRPNIGGDHISNFKPIEIPGAETIRVVLRIRYMKRWRCCGTFRQSDPFTLPTACGNVENAESDFRILKHIHILGPSTLPCHAPLKPRAKDLS